MDVFLNETFIDEKEASLGITDLAIQRGYGIFDFFRTRNYVPLFLEDYLDRFFQSCRVLNLICPHNREALKNIIFELLNRNKIETSGVKMILTGGYSPDGFETGLPNLIITQQPVEIATEAKFEKGIKIILHQYQRDLPTAKSINYLMAVYLNKTVREKKADDVLYFSNNHILEFPRSNVFIVTKDQEIVTPLENVLHGITRKKVIEIAGKNYKTAERTITIEELKNAAEIFLTSTTKRLLPVLTINDSIVGDGKPGKITRKLYADFLKVEKDYCNDHVVAY